MGTDQLSNDVVEEVLRRDAKQAALDYHAYPTAGKIGMTITTPANNQNDLSLAYSPGVAEPVHEISQDLSKAYNYTAKGNLVAVISNGTAILGLGNLGALPSKPVMEGKCLLFKRFGGIDSVDIEVDSKSNQQFIETVRCISDTFGGINLEDIKAPDCFEIEEALIEQCDVPVFHDDQHGTAIVTVAGMLNALELQNKAIQDAVIVCLGAGAAAIACARLLLSAGAQKKNIIMLDSKGVIHSERQDLNAYKAEFAIETELRTLDEAIEGADVFLGLSGPDLFSVQQLSRMGQNPIVFACSNPDPEIRPEIAMHARKDLIIATGRSDYPNQVNNVLCFPFLFRGVLDVRAKRINTEMKLAAVDSIRNLAKRDVPQVVLDSYGKKAMGFGKDYILPTPLDPRLLPEVAAAVAQAAVRSGEASMEVPKGYVQHLEALVESQR